MTTRLHNALRIAAVTLTSFAIAALIAPSTADAKPSGDKIIKKVLDVDSFGLSGADVSARLIIRDAKAGKKRKLKFSARSFRHAAPLAKSLVRFSAPADIAGMGFLQIQNKKADDDRYLFLPDLGKSRRIAGKTRKQSFMGTDFTYADLDRRDIRDSKAKFIKTADINGVKVHVVEVKPTGADRQYSKIKIWVRTDNYVTVKSVMYNRSGTKVKTRLTRSIKKVNKRWYITKSVMLDHQRKRSTEMILDRIDADDSIKSGEFTVRNLEKL